MRWRLGVERVGMQPPKRDLKQGEDGWLGFSRKTQSTDVNT